MASSAKKTRHVDSRFYGIAGGFIAWFGVIMTISSLLQVIALAAEGINPITGLTTWGYVLISYGIAGTCLALYTVVIAIRHTRNHSLRPPERSLMSLPYIKDFFVLFVLLANLIMHVVRFLTARRHTA